MGILSKIFGIEKRQPLLSFDCDAPLEQSGYSDTSGHQRRLVVKQLKSGTDSWTLEFKVKEPSRENGFDNKWKFDGYPEGACNKAFTAANAILLIDNYFNSLPQPGRYGAGILKNSLREAVSDKGYYQPSVPNAHPA